MASAIATGKPEAADPRSLPDDGPPRERKRDIYRRLPLVGSRLGRLILGLNLLGLLVLIVGALVLNESRRGLIQARLDSLDTQGSFIAAVLDRAATVGEPQPALDTQLATETLQFLFIPRSTRARLFDADGQLIADTYVLSDQIQERPLPPVRKPGSPAPFQTGPQAERSAAAAARARSQLSAEVAAALTGHAARGLRISESGERRVSVSLPLQHVKAVLGVLTLDSGDVDATVWAQRKALLPFIMIAVGATIVSSLLLATLVARPILRLARAADAVRLSRARAISLPDLSDREDEVGGLARALEAMTDAQSARMDAIERFAADVAHEIKNPLTSMRSAVETLEMAPAGSPQAERLTGILKADLKRLDRLITDIANASRLDAELSRDAPRAVDLGRLLGDVVETYDGEGGARVVLQRSDALDAFAVTGREGPLGRVFRNLVDNARSFSATDGEVRVALSRRRDGAARWVVATVDDDGPGIPPENLETVFDRFYTSRPRNQAGGSKGFGGHSGLGLAIARQIVAAHGGSLLAENRALPDGTTAGARFTVLLPERAA